VRNVHPFTRALAGNVEGHVKTGTVFRRARDGVLFALLGSRTGDDAGLGIGGRIAVTLLAIGIATLVWMAARFIGVVGAASFYFPAVLVVTLFAGWEFGLAAVLASASLIWTLAGRHLPLVPLAVFVFAGLVEVLLAGFLRELLREAWHAERSLQSLAEQQEREARAREIVLGETRHRLKNLMAIIEALAKFSGTRPGENPDIDGFLERFIGRLRALGVASDLVLKYGPGVLEANAVVSAVLEPFLSESPQRLRFDGPELELSEQFGGALAMAVHELATNALKYGALSAPTGSVAFSWSATPCDGGEKVAFVWKEEGGPSPRRPEKDGYGHRMIRSVAARETGGEVEIDYRPDGLVCRIAYRRPIAAAGGNSGV
jgi:two-component sensor histidine kinase